jgi:hypothetical protein
VFVVYSPIWITVDAGAGGLATDHRWVPQLKTPGPDWLGKNPAARCAACAGVVDLGHPFKQYDRCVRSAFNAVRLAWRRCNLEETGGKDTTRV